MRNAWDGLNEALECDKIDISVYSPCIYPMVYSLNHVIMIHYIHTYIQSDYFGLLCFFLVGTGCSSLRLILMGLRGSNIS